MLFKSSNKKSHGPWGSDHPEKLKDSDGSSGFDIKRQLKGILDPTSVIESVVGLPGNHHENGHAPASSEHKKPAFRNETIIFNRQAKEGEVQLQKETRAVLEQLKHQITALEKSEKTLSHEISKIKVEQLPAKSGIYYLRYFEWLIGVIHQLRMRVEEGKAWLQTFNGRQNKKAGFWQKYKKHGTSFGMSKEHSLSHRAG